MRILGAVGAALLMFILARTTDASFIGEFQLVLTIALGLSIIARGGRDRVITKFIAQEENTQLHMSILKSSVYYIIKRLLVIGSLVLIFIYTYSSFSNKYSNIYWVFYLLIFISFSTLISGFYKGLFKPNISYIYEMGFISLISAIIFYIFHFFGFSDSYFYFSLVVTFLLLITFFLYKNKFFSSKFFNNDVFSMQSNNFMWMTFVVYLQQLLIVLMLSTILDIKELGFFKVAEKIALLVGFFQSVITAIYSPYFSKYYKENNKNKILETVKKSLFLGISISIPSFIFIVFFGENILGYFGEEFSNGYNILIVLAFAQLLNVMFSVSSIFLNQTIYTEISKNIILYASLISLPLTAFLCLYYSSIGAAISILAYNAMLNISFTYYAYKGYKSI